MTKEKPDIERKAAQYIKIISEKDNPTASEVATMNMAWAIATNLADMELDVDVSDTEVERILQQMPTTLEHEQSRDGPIGQQKGLPSDEAISDVCHWHELELDPSDMVPLIEDAYGVSLHRDTVRRYVKDYCED